jgi:hypothetical protein
LVLAHPAIMPSAIKHATRVFALNGVFMNLIVISNLCDRAETAHWH